MKATPKLVIQRGVEGVVEWRNFGVLATDRQRVLLVDWIEQMSKAIFTIDQGGRLDQAPDMDRINRMAEVSAITDPAFHDTWPEPKNEVPELRDVMKENLRKTWGGADFPEPGER